MALGASVGFNKQLSDAHPCGAFVWCFGMPTVAPNKTLVTGVPCFLPTRLGFSAGAAAIARSGGAALAENDSLNPYVR